MNGGTRQISTRSNRQGGAAAIEFAFVFPLLLLVIYSTIVYSYVFFLQQTINLVAQESAKAAVALAPSIGADGSVIVPDYSAAVTAYDTASRESGFLAALPAAQQADIPTPIVSPAQDITVVDSKGQNQVIGRTITVTVYFNNVTTIFPQIGLPGIGAALPPLPTTLVARASVRVS